MTPVWSPEARDDVRAACDHIAEHDLQAAARLFARLVGIAPLLAAHPSLGRPGRVARTREFVVSRTPYIVVYRETDRSVQIVRVLHAARLWPQAF